ncbi:MAG: hypothetical protein SWK76_08295 [Actinomycetota bacterium]|nr:hypothetical protein [Actinomycetota bacterium]
MCEGAVVVRWGAGIENVRVTSMGDWSVCMGERRKTNRLESIEARYRISSTTSMFPGAAFTA